MEGPQNRTFETHAYILSVVPPKEYLRDSRPRGDTVAQGIGETHFTLLEMIPERGVKPHPQERVPITRDTPSKIDHVRRRIFYEDLVPESVTELALVVEIIVTKYEYKYVQFFNEASPITTRMHSLQLLPGIGQTLMWAKKVITARIIDELREEVKRWLFVRPPKREENDRDHRDRPPRR